MVVGASGFVGSALMAELQGRGLPVTAVSAPRLRCEASTAQEIAAEAVAVASTPQEPSFAALRRVFDGVDVVINAAGLATPGDGESPELTGANALLPAMVVLAARAAGVRRVVHLSSASVQGHTAIIDESATRAPFSAYSRSKARGEEVLEILARDAAGDAAEGAVVTVRATSVQGPTRPTTRSLVRIAASPLASVASPGTAQTPVSSINALAWFVVETGLHGTAVPALVLQPWEGLNVAEVLSAAGGRNPLRLPAWLCRSILAAGYGTSKLAGERLHGPLRRVELMWFGQAQSPGWAERAGLVPEPALRDVLRQARGDDD